MADPLQFLGGSGVIHLLLFVFTANKGQASDPSREGTKDVSCFHIIQHLIESHFYRPSIVSQEAGPGVNSGRSQQRRPIAPIELDRHSSSFYWQLGTP